MTEVLPTRVACRFCAALFLAPSAGAWAQSSYPSRPAAEACVPSMIGATGLLQLPSAYVQPDRQLSLFAGSDSRGGSGGVLFGLADRLEIGAGTAPPLESGSSRGMTSAKLNLLPDQLLLPALAVGIADIPGAAGGVGSGYVVVSKYIPAYFVEALTHQRGIGIKLHLGYGGGFFRRRPFAAAEITAASGLIGIGESVGGRFSPGIRFVRSGFAVTLGWLQMSRAAGSISWMWSRR